MNCNTTHYRANSSSVPGDPTEFPQGFAGWENAIHPEDRERVRAQIQEHADGKRSNLELDYRLVTRSGDVRHIFDRGKIIQRDAAGKPLRLVGMITDITERKKAEHELRRANRALSVMTRCNESVVRALTEVELLQQICSIITEVGGYKLAWIGFAGQDDRKTIRPAASAGEAVAYLRDLHVSWADDAWGHGPSGQSIRTRKTVVTHKMVGNPSLAPWRADLIRAGLNASIVLPLNDSGKTIGMLAIYSSEPDAFDAEEVKLLGELAADVSFGVEALRTRNEQIHVSNELKQSQLRQRAILDNIPDLAWVKDLDSNYITANSAYAATQKIAPEGFAGRNDFEFYPRELAEQYRADDAVVIASRQRKRVEEPYIDANGQRTWIETIKTPIFNEAGEVVGTSGIARDITERRKTEEQLRLQSAALEAAANAIVIADCAGVIKWVNPAFEAVTGYPRSEAIGQNPRILKSGQVDPAVYRNLWSTVLSGKVWSGEMVNRRKDGSLYCEEQSITPVRNEAGKVTHFIAIKQDISARKLADAKIHEQAQLLDLAHDAILVEDLDYRVSYWNRGAERLYGWTTPEATGHNAIELLYKDGDQHHQARKELLEKGFWAGELRQTNKQGQELTVNGRWTLVRNSDGVPVSVLIINSDITENKKLEAQFMQAQRMESIGTLASGVAHDLNNILAPVLMASQILKMGPVDEETEKLLTTIEFSAQRGADVVKQLLTFARGIKGDRVQVQLRHLVKDLVKMARETFPRNINISSNIPGDLWVIMGDATQMHQVLLNLCVNARDAMPEGGNLAISAENLTMDESFASMMPEANPGPYVVVSVADTGTGIPASILSRIFDPFFTTKEQGKGTGLGLSTVMGIAKGHGGFIRVSSTLGKGTVFQVYLPATLNPAAQLQEQKEVALPQGNGELILVVDDEPNVREVCKKILTLNGYEVLVAGDGTEAMALFAQLSQRIYLVLTDIIMPFMDGLALVRALHHLSPEVKVIVSSGLGSSGSNEQRVLELKSLGVKRFLAKPYDAEILLTAVREAIQQPDQCVS